MRRATNLVSKLATAVGMPVEELEDFLRPDCPERFGQCWLGPRQVFHEGRPQPSLRLLYELKSGEPLRADQRLRNKLCPTVGCLNPNHYRARTYLTWRQRFCPNEVAPIDMTALFAEAQDPAILEAMDFNDVCDLVSSEEGGRDRSAADLHDQWPMYGVEMFERALAHLKAGDQAERHVRP